MAKKPTIFSQLTPAEQAAWLFILAFARERAAAIASAGWREDVTDLALSEIPRTPHLLARYLLAIGETDPAAHGSRRKHRLDSQVGKECRAATGGVVRLVGGRKVMRAASVGPHFTYTVLDDPNPPGGPAPQPPRPRP